MLAVKLLFLFFIISNVCCKSFSDSEQSHIGSQVGTLKNNLIENVTLFPKHRKPGLFTTKSPITTSHEPMSTEISYTTTTVAESSTTEDSAITTAENPTTDNPKTTETPETIIIEESTTVTEQSTTTTEATTKVDLPFCETSLHSKQDLGVMIDYIISKMDVFDNITLNANDSAEFIRDRYTQDLVQFHQWLQSRPEQLEHILKDFRSSREMLEPLVEEVADLIEKYPSIQEQFDEKMNTTHRLLADLGKINQMCKLNCEKNVIVEYSLTLENKVQYDPSEYYCGSIANIHKEIVVKFVNFSKLLQDEVKHALNLYDEYYHQEIDFLKDSISDQMLKKFDRTMYAVLNLRSDFYHFSQDIKNSKVESVINNIKYKVADVYAKLIRLEVVIQQYGKFCKTCSDELISRTLTLSSDGILTDDEPSRHNIFEDQIQLKMEQMRMEIENNIFDILSPLDECIEQSGDIEVYLEKQSEIRKTVVQEIEKEQNEFNRLKSKINPYALTKLSRLDNDSSDLLSSIIKSIDFLDQFFLKNN